MYFEDVNNERPKDQPCCYFNCDQPGAIHIGVNGNPETHWICFHHLNEWNADHARFIAQGLPCEMQELGEPLCHECWDDAANCHVLH